MDSIPYKLYYFQFFLLVGSTGRSLGVIQKVWGLRLLASGGTPKKKNVYYNLMLMQGWDFNLLYIFLFCKFVREYLSRLQFHLLLALLLVGRQGTRLLKLKLNNLQHLHLPVVQMQTRWIFFHRYTLYIWISDHKFEPCHEFEWWFCNLFPWKQGLPNMGSNAGAGTLDFLRNSQQVSMMFYLFASLLFICDVFWDSYFRFLFQFQALRTMVQANPQILQVPIMFCLHFNFYRNIVSLVH